MPLNKYLAHCGITSRRKAVLPIAQGRVVVNNQVVRESGRRIEVEKDTILLDGKNVKPPCCFRYVLLNKPRGVITAVDDGRGRKTVVDLLSTGERLFPVGRLDLDTEGALLLTNDGELAYRLTHPKYEIEKVYEALVKGQVKKETLEVIASGVALSEGVAVTGQARILKKNRRQTWIEIRVHEGKKRQIRQMMKAVGHPVVQLKRTQFAGLKVTGLASGKWRSLTVSEVKTLYQKVHV